MNSSPLSSYPIGKSASPSSEGQLWSAPVTLQSSLLARVAYNHGSAILRLEFCSGASYQYFHVPHQTYQDLLDADSKGAHFNRHIRNVFRWAHL